MKLVRFIFEGLLLCLIFINGTAIEAAGINDIIYEGSGRDSNLDLSPQDVQMPEFSGNSGEEKIDRAVLTLINVILYICGTAAGVMIIVGGIRYVISTGNDDMMTGAKKTILWAMGGLVATFLAWAIILNIVRISTLEERIDYSEDSAQSCGPNITVGCKGMCCGCGGPLECNDGLVCGGPLDVSGIKVCQSSASESSEGNDSTRTPEAL